MTHKKELLASDPSAARIAEVLSKFQRKHRSAKVDVYRTSNVAIRIRVIDPDFVGIGPVERDRLVWTFLDQLPDEVISEITLLLLFTPKEAKKNFANLEFENPVMKHVATIKTDSGFERIYQRREIYDTSDSEGNGLTPGTICFRTEDGGVVEQKTPGQYDRWIVDGKEYRTLPAHSWMVGWA